MSTTPGEAFGEQVFRAHHEAQTARMVAQETANANGAPVMILEREGWLAIIEEPPDEAECDPYGHGWTDYALITPAPQGEEW